jgi:hypothetical protein
MPGASLPSPPGGIVGGGGCGIFVLCFYEKWTIVLRKYTFQID